MNEDSFGKYEPVATDPAHRPWLYVVADGLGGHAAGDVASKLAVDTIIRSYRESEDHIDGEQALITAIERANQAVYHRSHSDERLREMGTTVVAALIDHDQVALANVGDSRAYLLRDAHIQQLTRDHSWVAKAMEEGVLTPDQARDHPDRNVIYRSLGAGAFVEVETYVYGLQDGDRVLLCTDGLTDVMADELIAELATVPEMAVAADLLVSGANNRGGPDNITVTLISIHPARPQGQSERPTPSRLRVLEPPSRRSRASTTPAERPTVPRGLRARPETELPSPGDGENPKASGRKNGWLRRLFRRD